MRKAVIVLVALVLFLAWSNSKAIAQSNIESTFVGNVGTQKVEMDVSRQRNGNKITGNCLYKSKRIKTQLKGTLDKQGNFIIEEFNNIGDKIGVFKGKLGSTNVNANYDDKMQGTWTSVGKGKSLNFTLLEAT